MIPLPDCKIVEETGLLILLLFILMLFLYISFTSKLFLLLYLLDIS